MMTSSRSGPTTFKDLTAGLIWPMLFRSVPLALQPSRLVVAFIGVALVMGLGSIHDWLTANAATGETGLFAAILSRVAKGVTGVARGVLMLDPPGIVESLKVLLSTRGLLWENPVSGGILALVTLCIWAVTGGAISRMVVCDVALGEQVGSARGMAFALARAKDLILSLLAPLLLIGALALGLMLAGLVLLRFPGVNVVGALLYGPMLCVGFVIVVLGIGLILGNGLLIAAVATESTDFFDAIQRAYAYLLGRTGRLLLYIAVLVVYGGLAYGVASYVAAKTLNGTARLAFAWTNVPHPPSAYAGGFGTFDVGFPHRGDGLEGSALAAARIIGVWERMVLAMLGSFAVSYVFAASSVLYLLARRVNDEQDIHEIWRPGMIESTFAPVKPVETAAASAGRAEGADGG